MKDLKHPYKKYEQTLLWELIEKSIKDLIENKDIELTTNKQYVVGYICKIINKDLKKIKKAEVTKGIENI